MFFKHKKKPLQQALFTQVMFSNNLEVTFDYLFLFCFYVNKNVVAFKF